MDGILILAGVSALFAYVVGYLVGRAEMDRTWRWRTRFYRIGRQMQQAYIDEPGNPRMN